MAQRVARTLHLRVFFIKSPHPLFVWLIFPFAFVRVQKNAGKEGKESDVELKMKTELSLLTHTADCSAAIKNRNWFENAAVGNMVEDIFFQHWRFFFCTFSIFAVTSETFFLSNFLFQLETFKVFSSRLKGLGRRRQNLASSSDNFNAEWKIFFIESVKTMSFQCFSACSYELYFLLHTFRKTFTFIRNILFTLAALHKLQVLLPTTFKVRLKLI